MSKAILFLTIISSAFSAYWGFKAFSEEIMRKLYIEWVYYILAANIFLWLLAIFNTKTKQCYKELTNYCKKHKWAIIIAFALTICGTLVSKPDFRILADETNLLSMSQALYENRECKNYTSVMYYYYGFKNVISSEIDKRPALFPLTVSFLHSILGYRPENAFLANILACFFSLLILYNLVSANLGRFWGKCSMVILAAYPLWVLYYTSAGFDVFNLLFSLILFWYLAKFIKEPSAANAEVLLLFLPLLSQTRYESSVSVLCVLPAVFIMLPKSEYLKFSYKLLTIPLFFVPVVWLRLLTDNSQGLQLVEVGKKSAFSWEFFVTNTKKAISFFRGEDIVYGTIPAVTYLAIAGAILAFLYIIFKRKRSYKKFVFWFVVFAFFVLHAVIRFAFYWGDLTYRFNSRLGIIFLPLLAYFAVCFFYNVRQFFGKGCKGCCALFVIVIWLVYWPVAGQNLGVRELTLYREFRAAREYLQEHFPNKNEFILVADRANLYVPLKYSCINFGYFRNNVSILKNNLGNRTYRYIVLLQTVNRASGKAIDICSIPASINPEVLYETQIKVDQYLRISKYDLSMDKKIFK